MGGLQNWELGCLSVDCDLDMFSALSESQLPHLPNEGVGLGCEFLGCCQGALYGQKLGLLN